MPEQLLGAPKDVALALQQLRDDLERAAGSNLAGLILYGGLARGRFVPGRSDVNVVVLLHDASAAALSAVVPAFRTAMRTAGVDALLMTPAEVPRAAEAFPTKFLDIKDSHIVLAGVDPFIALEVTREQIRLRCAQALQNMLLRLRRGYVVAGNDTAMLARTLARMARSLAMELEGLLYAAGHDVPEDDRTALVFDAAATAFGFEREPLARLAELRRDLQHAGDVPLLYRRVLEVIARAVEIAVRDERFVAMNPFDLRGPEFLALYVVVFSTIVAVAALLRWLFRYPFDAPPADLNLSAYEVAYLRGGDQLVFEAAIARLVHLGALTVSSTGEVKPRENGLLRGASEVDRAIYSLVKGPFGGRIKALRSAMPLELEPMRQRLLDLGLSLGASRARMARFIPMALVLLVPSLGVVKIVVGISRQRPVIFLVILCFFSVAAALWGFGGSVLRTQRGDRALKELRRVNAALEAQARRRVDGLAGEDLVLALGLFGMGVLDKTPMAKVRTALNPGTGSSGGSACASGCGSGCGGGCGGGGCGGCGGS